MIKIRQHIFFSLILLIFGIFLVWPIVQVIRVGIAPDYLVAVFKDDDLRQGLLNSLTIAVLVTVVCLLISVPLAMLSVRYDFRGKSIVSTLLLVPLILPPFVGAIGMRQILGRFGMLTSLAQDIGMVARG